MSTIEGRPVEAATEVTEQKNTYSTQIIYLPDFELPIPSELTVAASGLVELASTRVLQRAQQVLFLPCFATTDHIFYGDFINSENPQEGFASVRMGVVEAANFHISIMENFNNRRGHMILRGDRSNNRRVYLNFLLAPGMEQEDSDLTLWLDHELFTPLRDELMGYQEPESEF